MGDDIMVSTHQRLAPQPNGAAKITPRLPRSIRKLAGGITAEQWGSGPVMLRSHQRWIGGIIHMDGDWVLVPMPSCRAWLTGRQASALRDQALRALGIRRPEVAA